MYNMGLNENARSSGKTQVNDNTEGKNKLKAFRVIFVPSTAYKHEDWLFNFVLNFPPLLIWHFSYISYHTINTQNF